jgi:hypothetical protein
MQDRTKTWLGWIMAGAVPLLIIAFGFPESARPQEITERARIVGLEWLLSNCEIGEGTRLTAQLAQFGAELEPFFLRALQEGPDNKLLSDHQRASETRYQQRQEMLKSGRRLPLSDDDRKAAQAITQEQYLAQEKEDFVLRYKSQAVAGLGIVGGPKAKSLLEPLSKDEKSPLRGSAQEALKRMASSEKKR